MSDAWDGVGPDTPTRVSENGAKQSDIPYRFDLIDGNALAVIAKVLKTGAEKYGENVWRLMTIEEQLNHMIAHAYAYLSGDRSDDHLSHVACRALFALGTDRAEPKEQTE